MAHVALVHRISAILNLGLFTTPGASVLLSEQTRLSAHFEFNGCNQGSKQTVLFCFKTV